MLTNHEDWCRFECGQCKWFKVNADMENVESTCKRLDHKHLRFAKPIFKCYDCGTWNYNTCADFEPDKGKVPWLYDHWEEVRKEIVPYSATDIMSLNVDGNTDVRYVVRASEFYDGTFLNEDGSLRWLYKYYQVRSQKSVTGYKTVYEMPDGTKLINQEWKARELTGGGTLYKEG